MTETTIAELEQRVAAARAAAQAASDVSRAASEALIEALQKDKEAMAAEAEARAAWETARRGGPLAPAAVLETLRQAGVNEPAELFAVERAGYLAPLPYAVWLRPLTRVAQQLPRELVQNPLLEAGYYVRAGHTQRYRLRGERTTGWYEVTEVERPVPEAHQTVADVDEAWQEEVEMMARA